eukprot:maker-scaffold_9-augustus-gene-5.0-mRNA-1 protein AED:0.08 eAED:0.22 QI:1614/0/0.2/1/0.75/1/5/0/579
MGATVFKDQELPDYIKERVFKLAKEVFENEIKQHEKQMSLKTFPDTFEDLLRMQEPNDDSYDVIVFNRIERAVQEGLEALIPPVLNCNLQGLPDKLEESVYVHERWPLICDPEDQVTRFLRYQRGTIFTDSPTQIHELEPTKLANCTISLINSGAMLVLYFDSNLTAQGTLEERIRKVFESEKFPVGFLNKKRALTPEVLGKMMGKDELAIFVPKDEFKLVLVTNESKELGDEIEKTASFLQLSLVNVGSVESKSRTEELELAVGAKEVKRNSMRLVEAAFDGDLDVIKSEMELGYSVESTDGHDHTALSEAACNNQLEVVQFLIETGCDPNTRNDQGRTPIFPLLENGGDPSLEAGLETPMDVTKNDEVLNLLKEWATPEKKDLTQKLKSEYEAKQERELESRLKTASERDHFAREKIRMQLVELVVNEDQSDDETRIKLQERLQELAAEAIENNERPRGSAEVRDDQGQTCLLLAMVLNEGCDPYQKNSYNKNAFDFAKDDLDAAKNILKDRSEIREVLLNWEKQMHPKFAKEKEIQKKYDEATKKTEKKEKSDTMSNKIKRTGNKKGKNGKRGKKK